MKRLFYESTVESRQTLRFPGQIRKNHRFMESLVMEMIL
jgi:hypothetical protein